MSGMAGGQIPVEDEFWVFFLADQLHKTPDEIRLLAAADYVALISWYQVKGVMTDLAQRTAASRAG